MCIRDRYQWVALPMARHGVIAKKDGTVVNVTIGEDEDDPVVYITDLLIHLAGQQMAKKASEAVEGEKLDILIGSQPLKDLPDDKKKEAVKENVLRILNEKYGVEAVSYTHLWRSSYIYRGRKSYKGCNAVLEKCKACIVA